MKEKHIGGNESKGIFYDGLEEFTREKIREHLQDLLEQEVSEWLGREKSERKLSPLEQPGYRNGYGKRRRFTMSLGTIEIRRPMDRKFKPPFFWRRYSAELPSVSSAQELGENRGFASAGCGGAAARKCSIGAPSRRAARTQSERRRWIALATGFGSQVVWKRSNRCAGERGGARVGRPRWVRILIITGGSSIAVMIFKAPPQLGQCSMSMSKTRLRSRAQLMRAGAPCACASSHGDSVAGGAGVWQLGWTHGARCPAPSGSRVTMRSVARDPYPMERRPGRQGKLAVTAIPK